MYKKVLYNIKKIKKMWGGGGAIFEPKTLSMYLKKKKKKKEKKNLTEPGIEPTASWIEKPALLSTRLNTISACIASSPRLSGTGMTSLNP